MKHKYTNALINETSPYLLQHAHNPVHWKAWSANTLELAKKENKLIIISVGYAACHWCHVMEHESFEDEEVAIVMNSNFINIKIDREERPDIDQVYMNAVQLMTGSGGWPMNVVALPDGRPVWGGTYFKKAQWVNALSQIVDLYKKNPDKLYEYAAKLTKGIKAMDLIKVNTNEPKFNTTFIKEIIADWSAYFDTNKGGIGKEPKFMMPNNYQFLLRYGYQKQDKNILDFVNTTLTKMAYGGIYDQIGGGFSRYSVDDKWHVPHFEKMLYDNGQLVSLYAEAYALTKNELYKNVITETLAFINRELTGVNGIFYSSLDADSLTEDNILEEGAYYVWKKEELERLLKDDFKLFSNYYNINNYGYWEHKNYVLIRDKSDKKIIKEHNLTLKKLNEKKENWKSILLKEREKRNPPRLDDKTLTSWNALMLKGYVDAYRVLQNENYLNCALNNAEFILKNQLKEDGSLYHNYKKGTSSIIGFLEDYATTIEAFIALYEVTSTTKWLDNAKALTDYCFDTFFDTKSQLFFFTSNRDQKLIVQTIEYRDNVIPASNSIMANCLYKLSHYYNNSHYINTCKNMLNNIKPEIHRYGSAFSNWMNLMLNFTEPFYEVAITGKNANEKVKELNKEYLPNKIIASSTNKNNLLLLNNRYVENKTPIYVCVNNTCKLPVTNVNAAISQLKIN